MEQQKLENLEREKKIWSTSHNEEKPWRDEMEGKQIKEEKVEKQIKEEKEGKHWREGKLLRRRDTLEPAKLKVILRTNP